VVHRRHADSSGIGPGRSAEAESFRPHHGDEPGRHRGPRPMASTRRPRARVASRSPVGEAASPALPRLRKGSVSGRLSARARERPRAAGRRGTDRRAGAHRGTPPDEAVRNRHCARGVGCQAVGKRASAWGNRRTPHREVTCEHPLQPVDVVAEVVVEELPTLGCRQSNGAPTLTPVAEDDLGERWRHEAGRRPYMADRPRMHLRRIRHDVVVQQHEQVIAEQVENGPRLAAYHPQRRSPSSRSPARSGAPSRRAGRVGGCASHAGGARRPSTPGQSGSAAGRSIARRDRCFDPTRYLEGTVPQHHVARGGLAGDRLPSPPLELPAAPLGIEKVNALGVVEVLHLPGHGEDIRMPSQVLPNHRVAHFCAPMMNVGSGGLVASSRRYDCTSRIRLFSGSSATELVTQPQRGGQGTVEFAALGA
jgi:hypothetical protein